MVSAWPRMSSSSAWMRCGLAAARQSTRRRRLGGDAGARDLSEDLATSEDPCARVAQVERLVDQRKVRNDVADHRVLEHRPVLPRRVVAVAAARWRRPASSSSATSTSPRQPSTQPAPSAARAGSAQFAARAARRQAGAERADQAQRFERPRRSAPPRAPRRRRSRCVAMRTVEAVVRRPGLVAAQVGAWPLARPASPVRPSCAASCGVTRPVVRKRSCRPACSS